MGRAPNFYMTVEKKMQEIDTKKLAKELAAELARRNSYLITSKGVAEILGVTSESIPLREVLADKTFPPPISLTSSGVRRWRRPDVIAWVDAHYGE